MQVSHRELGFSIQTGMLTVIGIVRGRNYLRGCIQKFPD